MCRRVDNSKAALQDDRSGLGRPIGRSGWHAEKVKMWIVGLNVIDCMERRHITVLHNVPICEATVT